MLQLLAQPATTHQKATSTAESVRKDGLVLPQPSTILFKLTVPLKEACTALLLASPPALPVRRATTAPDLRAA